MDGETLLKQDLFGTVQLVERGGDLVIVRDTLPARWWLRWLARLLLRREAAALAALDHLDGVPALLRYDGSRLERSFLRGQPMHVAKPVSPLYFKQALTLLRKLHRAGVCHNDLAKEPNLLVRDDGSPAFIDFQLGAYSNKRGKFFRAAAREDLRHLLKHKRTYIPERLTMRQQRLLASPSPVARVWMATAKPVYLFVTRRLLGWADREGAGDRGQRGGAPTNK